MRRGASLTAGSLTAANDSQSYAYDTLDRLTNGSLGSYTYGDSAHLHGATAIGSAYSAKYDAVGDMTCRAPTSTTTCAGTPTGAQLSYDNEGRLAGWQDAPSSPTTTDAFLYDGAGNRVAQQVTVGGSITTTTTYVGGGQEEITTTSSGSTLTKYFSGASGLPTAERVGTSGPLSYLATDGLGSVSESLDGSGSVTFQQLYDPYGNTRYTSGTSPTSRGYTGQRADGATGLDYYQARYYDPVAGQFTSADSMADGLNRYGYVGGNPTTATDPSGHMACDADFGQCVAPTHYQGQKKEIVPGPKAGDHHPCTFPTSLLDPKCGVSIPGSPPKKGQPNQQPPQQKHPTQQQVKNARQDALAGVGDAQGWADFYRGILSWMNANLKIPLLNVQVPLVFLGIDEALSSLIDEANMIKGWFLEQTKWSDAQWTAGNVAQFQSKVNLEMEGIMQEVLVLTTLLVSVPWIGQWEGGTWGVVLESFTIGHYIGTNLDIEHEALDLTFG